MLLSESRMNLIYHLFFMRDNATLYRWRYMNTQTQAECSCKSWNGFWKWIFASNEILFSEKMPRQQFLTIVSWKTEDSEELCRAIIFYCYRNAKWAVTRAHEYPALLSTIWCVCVYKCAHYQILIWCHFSYSNLWQVNTQRNGWMISRKSVNTLLWCHQTIICFSIPTNTVTQPEPKVWVWGETVCLSKQLHMGKSLEK